MEGRINIAHMSVAITTFGDAERPEDRGFYDPKRQVVGINKSLPHEEQIETLFHELAHVWMWATGHHDRRLTEEDAASIMGRASAAFFMQNPEYALAFLSRRLLNGYRGSDAAPGDSAPRDGAGAERG